MSLFSKNSKNIPFIHNYCDRWCERCTFTSRCAVAENESKLSPEQKDISNKAFWDNMANNFAESLILLRKEAIRHGIDVDNFTKEELDAYDKKEKDYRKRAENTTLIKACKTYMDKAHKFVNAQPNFKEKQNEIISHVEMGIKSINDANFEATTIMDCVEVIAWYCHFIYVKFMRAMPSEIDDEDALSDIKSDNNGSAKIALIAVERSTMAWQKLYDLLPASDDLALNQLALLQRIDRLGKEFFPNAMRFKRPGFDG